VYSGVQTMDSSPLYFGLAYNEYNDQRSGFIHIREAARYSDGLNMKILRADADLFFQLSLKDSLNTEFVINVTCVRVSNGSFVFQVSGEMIDDEGFGPSLTSVYFYIGLSEGSFYRPASNTSQLLLMSGITEGTGNFSLKTIAKYSSEMEVPYYYYGANTTTPFYATDTLLSILKSGVDEKDSPACCSPLNHNQLLPNACNNNSPNLMIVQKVLKTPFQWTVGFETGNDRISNDFNFIDARMKAIERFEKKFDQSFPLNSLNSCPELLYLAPEQQWREFGLQLLASLLYGLSYFEGDALAKDPISGYTWTLKNRKLLTLIPAKLGFPRGFWWDEGFHQMILLRFNKQLHEEITTYWFDLQNETTGWIAREQIIGTEARLQAPEWAWSGLINQMNPPIFYLTEEQYLIKDPNRASQFIRNIFNKMKLTYTWYKNELQSDVSNTFTWNGRVGDSSLDSGLDDWPRSFKMTHGEKNVDIQAWMAASAKALVRMAHAIGDKEAALQYQRDFDDMLLKLQQYYWNEQVQFYTDVADSSGKHMDHIGFPGALPICLGIETNKTRINQTIEKMASYDYLLDTHGFLSLSKSDRYWRTTGNYWRGNLWVNQQYLCCQGLKQYEDQFPKAKILRHKVQTTFLTTMLRNYFFRKNGGIFETYHPISGKGYNNAPFAGWSSLALLMLSEDYLW
jgi:mannosyl-oligosaccharide glucosidase